MNIWLRLSVERRVRLLALALLLVLHTSLARAQGVPAQADAPGAAPRVLDTWGTDEATESPEAPAETPAPSAPKAPEAPRASDMQTGPLTPSDCPCEDEAQRDSGVPLRYTLERIEIRGNTRTRDRVVLRYLPFKPGGLFDVEDPEVELSRFRLLGTGFFRDVQFSLKKGSARGFVVLIVDVDERNTIVVNDISMGISQDIDTNGRARPLTAYAGLDVAETNLLGTGMTLGSAAAIADHQLALRVRFLDPAFLGSSWMTSGLLLYNSARDFFGNAKVLWSDPDPDVESGPSAVVRYTRFGGSLGVGRDLSVSTQFWLHYRLETIEANYPLQASHLRGLDREPIDFDIIRGRSVLSTLRGTLQHDTRDHPFLPTRGWFATATAEIGLLPMALDYDYQRLDVSASRWWKLPWKNHVLRLELFAGAIAGDAPFFEQYYVGDFSDFLPDRVLGVNFDRRPPKNFLGTQIVEVRYGKYAFKLGAEYRIPLYRGRHSIYGIDFFSSFGMYGVAGDRDLTSPPRAYSGLARIPVDLTANAGVRMDTSAGGFVFAFSNILGFIQVPSEEPAGE